MSKKLTNLISVVLMVIGAAVGIYAWIRCGQLSEDKVAMAASIDPLFIWTYILVIVAVLALILVPIPYMISNPGSMKKFGLGIVALGVVLLVTFMLSSGEDLPFIENAKSKNEWSKLADMNIISLYIMTALAVLAVIASGVKGLFSSK